MNVIEIRCLDWGHVNKFKVKPVGYTTVGNVKKGALGFDQECKNCTADFRVDYAKTLKEDGKALENLQITGGDLVSNQLDFVDDCSEIC